MLIYYNQDLGSQMLLYQNWNSVNQAIYVAENWQWRHFAIQMMKSLLIQIGNFDRKMVGYIILEFTNIRLNVNKRNCTSFFKV